MARLVTCPMTASSGHGTHLAAVHRGNGLVAAPRARRDTKYQDQDAGNTMDQTSHQPRIDHIRHCLSTESATTSS